jgi:nucleoside-diphosphate-sugar epimerase
MMAESFYRSFGTPVSVCRPFNTYGPRQSARAVIPTIISQLASGAKKIKLGSLTPVRDLTYVSDTVDGFIKMAESEKSAGELINLGTGSGISIGELAKIIMDIMGAHTEILTDEQRVRPAKSEVMNLISDNTKAANLIGWKPKVTLEEGLKATVEFVKANLDKYKPGIYNL